MMGRIAVFLLVLGMVGAARNVWATEGVTVATGSSEASQPKSEGASEATELLLKQRVMERWQALIRGDFDAAYQLETPAYRAIYTPSQFRYQFGNQTLWNLANVKEIHYDGSTVARVWVEIGYRYAEPGRSKDNRMLNMTHGIKEIWLYKDGQWWHQQD